MAFNYWTCPSCGILVHEDYLKCNCGYVTTREEVEKIKEDLANISEEQKRRRQEEHQQALEKKKEEKRLAFARREEQQRLEFQKQKEERLRSIEKQKEEKLKLLEKQEEENKKVLQQKLSELKELFDTGIITEEEHKRRRQTILDKFFEVSDVNVSNPSPQTPPASTNAQQLSQQMLLQDKMNLLPGESILIEGLSTYIKSALNSITCRAFLTNYRLVFCNTGMVGAQAWFGVIGAVAALARKPTKITFQVPLAQIASVVKGKHVFATKYTVSTLSGQRYNVQFSEGDRWETALMSLRVQLSR
jgi:hypothetical protein